MRCLQAILWFLHLGQPEAAAVQAKYLGLTVRTLVQQTVIFHKINRHWEYHRDYESGWDEHGA